MTEYRVELHDYESGLTANAITAQFEEQYPDATVTVERVEE